MNRSLLFLSLLMLPLFIGCGSKHGSFGSVVGTVRYKGQPLASGSVLFDVAGARQAQGKIVDGKIVEVTAYDPGDGVPVGHARIAVFAAEAEAADPSANHPTTPEEAWAARGKSMTAPKSLIPQKYNNLATSGFTCEITTGQNEVNLDLSD